jgi:tetratricopeptide (TPR) repeat protein
MAEQAIEKDPSLPLGQYARAVALEKIGKKEEALSAYEKTLELDPGMLEAKLAIIRLKTAIPIDPEPYIQELDRLLLTLSPIRDRSLYLDTLFLKGELLLRSERIEEAKKVVDLLENLAGSDPRLLTLKEKMTSLKEPVEHLPPPSSQERKEEGKRALWEEKKPVPSQPLPKKERTTPEEKTSSLEKVVEEGRNLRKNGYLLEARRTLEDGIIKYPDSWEIHLELGEVLFEMGEINRALKTFIQAGKMNPREPRVYLNLGAIYMLQNDPQRARKAYELFLKYAPPDHPHRKEVEKIVERLK